MQERQRGRAKRPHLSLVFGELVRALLGGGDVGVADAALDQRNLHHGTDALEDVCKLLLVACLLQKSLCGVSLEHELPVDIRLASVADDVAFRAEWLSKLFSRDVWPITLAVAICLSRLHAAVLQAPNVERPPLVESMNGPICPVSLFVRPCRVGVLGVRALKLVKSVQPNQLELDNLLDNLGADSICACPFPCLVVSVLRAIKGLKCSQNMLVAVIPFAPVLVCQLGEWLLLVGGVVNVGVLG
mmetsp:Transcript_13881/g.27447  ORF Transcript_13881/g.27447 Transcript_13881/m.27447 type:complete len:244 (+) Transcript_13881:382-1113(+)